MRPPSTANHTVIQTTAIQNFALRCDNSDSALTGCTSFSLEQWDQTINTTICFQYSARTRTFVQVQPHGGGVCEQARAIRLVRQHCHAAAWPPLDHADRTRA